MAASSPKYTFKYVKNADFKTVKVDGVYGGITIRGDINMNFYIETVDLPDSLQYTMNERGDIVKEIVAEKKPESTRELSVGINMDMATAKSFVIWLSDKVKLAEDAIAKTKERNK